MFVCWWKVQKMQQKANFFFFVHIFKAKNFKKSLFFFFFVHIFKAKNFKKSFLAVCFCYGTFGIANPGLVNSLANVSCHCVFVNTYFNSQFDVCRNNFCQDFIFGCESSVSVKLFFDFMWMIICGMLLHLSIGLFEPISLHTWSIESSNRSYCLHL